MRHRVAGGAWGIPDLYVCWLICICEFTLLLDQLSYVGEEAWYKRAILNIFPVMEEGVYLNISDFERILWDLFAKKMSLATECKIPYPLPLI